MDVFGWPAFSNEPVLIPPGKSMKEGLKLEVHGYIPYFREMGQVGDRPVCALPKAQQDAAMAAGKASANAPMPDIPCALEIPVRRPKPRPMAKSHPAVPVKSLRRYGLGCRRSSCLGQTGL